MPLAVMYLAHGWWFVAWPAASVERMRQQNLSNSLLHLSPGFRRFIGVAEWLAALVLMIVMGSATLLHLSKRETPAAVFTAVAFVLVTFVAYMRWQVIPL